MKTCTKCGTVKPLHHEDYTKRLEVIWLCSRCHRERHVGAGASDENGATHG